MRLRPDFIAVCGIVWLFTVTAAGHTPEAVALPIRLVTAIGPMVDVMMFTRTLVAKRMATSPDDRHGRVLVDSGAAARAHGGDEQRFKSAAIGGLATITYNR